MREGVLEVGDRLPTQAELASEFEVERGTVRLALQILKDARLLDNVSKGSPPRVAALPSDEFQRPRATVVSLNEHLAQAFSSPHVTIDAICFTAETLMLGLNHMRSVIAKGVPRPESITMRCLLPGPRIELAFPLPVPRPDRTADEQQKLTASVQQKLRSQIKHQKTVMEQTFYAWREGDGIRATVSFGWLPTTPMQKSYVLNGERALLGDYVPKAYPPSDDPGGYEVEVYDVRGFDTTLFAFRSEDGPRDAELVKKKQEAFNAVWATYVERPTLA
ncbi:GntR family transcriptional regulator [Streptomyces populi]|uniref:GntR family transcriptional regulator n=2 Tax=Streptomyces populi TaxID=2058924 RepID=A0A2I0SIM7_9ACTN|nr:GntR family transcriptional regulator [Streptomyces populi]